MTALTQEQKRIKIAEACGWRHDKSADYDAFYNPAGNYSGGATHDLGRAIQNAGIPDFFGDLNACHEMEKALERDGDIERYMDALTDVCGGDVPHGTASFTAYFATATQRAESFGLTLKLWER